MLVQTAQGAGPERVQRAAVIGGLVVSLLALLLGASVLVRWSRDPRTWTSSSQYLRRGIMTSLVSSGASAAMMIGFGSVGAAPNSTAILIGVVLAQTLGFLLDQTFATNEAVHRRRSGASRLSNFRGAVADLSGPKFGRFLEIVALDAAISYGLIDAMRTHFEGPWMRIRVGGVALSHLSNVALTSSAGILLFLLYSNFMRFTWAYNESPSQERTIQIHLLRLLAMSRFIPSADQRTHVVTGIAVLIFVAMHDMWKREPSPVFGRLVYLAIFGATLYGTALSASKDRRTALTLASATFALSAVPLVPF